MFLLSRPSEAVIRSFLVAQKGRPFSYAELGASRDRAPVGYVVDHNRIALGQGAAVFDRAVDALRRWQMFQIPWTNHDGGVLRPKDIGLTNCIMRRLDAKAIWRNHSIATQPVCCCCPAPRIYWRRALRFSHATS